jgi:hypothetical protein
VDKHTHGQCLLLHKTEALMLAKIFPGYQLGQVIKDEFLTASQS